MPTARALRAAFVITSGILLAAAAPAAAVTAADPPWLPPVVPPVVARSFDAPAAPWLSGHRGVDLRAPVGSIVRAPAAGRVTFAGPVGPRTALTLDHGQLRTSYLPINVVVTRGQSVAAGEIIGTVGSGHCGREACLHMGLRRGQEYLDPLLVLSRPTARLVPW